MCLEYREGATVQDRVRSSSRNNASAIYIYVYILFYFFFFFLPLPLDSTIRNLFVERREMCNV